MTRAEMLEKDVQTDAQRFLKAHQFNRWLRKYQKALTQEEHHDLRQMALDGNIETAYKKLEIILQSKSV